MTAMVMNGQVEQTFLTLNNGVQMPQFGLGVYSIPDGDETYNSVMTALKCGYRHIDTAHAYRNERSVGRAVKDSGIDRSEIWITSKLWPNEHGEGKTLKAIDRWHMQMGFSVIPGASNPDYIHENIETFDFALSNHEMERMHQLNKEKRYFNMSYEDQVKWFSQFNLTD
ncbi:MAG: aldo/keto reductase [Prevotella sp.]|nr:aldo/keto reductase [Prevotella sp.]